MPSIFSDSPRIWQASPGVNPDELGSALAGLFSGAEKAMDTGDKTTNFMQRFSQGYMQAQDSNFDLKKKSALLSIDSKKVELDAAHMQLDDQKQGLKEYPEWLKSTGGDWRKVLDTPFNGTSNYAAELVAKQKQQAWQRSIQEQSVQVRQQDVQNKIDTAKVKADLEKSKNENWMKIHEEMVAIDQQKAAATKAGQQFEFKDLQDDYDKTMQEAATEQDPDKYASLMAHKDQTLARMKKISEFASQVPSEKQEKITYDESGKPIKKITTTGPVKTAPATSSKQPKAAMLKPTPQDVSYLAAHPELKDKFEARFGNGTADQYLP